MSHTVVFIFPSPSDSVFLSLGGGGKGGVRGVGSFVSSDPSSSSSSSSSSSRRLFVHSLCY